MIKLNLFKNYVDSEGESLTLKLSLDGGNGLLVVLTDLSIEW